jgi:hypothetical protein
MSLVFSCSITKIAVIDHEEFGNAHTVDPADFYPDYLICICWPCRGDASLRIHLLFYDNDVVSNIITNIREISRKERIACYTETDNLYGWMLTGEADVDIVGTESLVKDDEEDEWFMFDPS